MSHNNCYLKCRQQLLQSKLNGRGGFVIIMSDFDYTLVCSRLFKALSTHQTKRSRLPRHHTSSPPRGVNSLAISLVAIANQGNQPNHNTSIEYQTLQDFHLSVRVAFQEVDTTGGPSSSCSRVASGNNAIDEYQ